MKIGLAIKETRELLGVSKEEIRGKVGLSRSQYDLIEQGGSSPPFSKFFKIAEVLGVSPSLIVYRAEQIASRMQKDVSRKQSRFSSISPKRCNSVGPVEARHSYKEDR